LDTPKRFSGALVDFDPPKGIVEVSVPDFGPPKRLTGASELDFDWPNTPEPLNVDLDPPKTDLAPD
jgi:hypothetical protein